MSYEDIILKPSKYNFYCANEDGNLLLTNFIKGPKSFSMIQKKYIDQTLNLLNERESKYKEDSKLIRDLFSEGFLIRIEEDEELIINSLYMNAIMDTRLTLIIMPTEQCNFRCKYCYELFEKGTMTKTIQNAIIKFIQKNAYLYSGIEIEWFGGEPLEAYDEVLYIMENVKKLCKIKNIAYYSGMTTNAYNLTKERFEQLYDLRVHNYQITIDGLRNQHDNQRINADGSGTYDKIIKNLHDIKMNKKYNKAEIVIRTNVTKEILEHISEYVNFMKESFLDDRRFSLRFNQAGDIGGERVKSFKDKLIGNEDMFSSSVQAVINQGNESHVLDKLRCFTPMGLKCYASRKNCFVIGSDANIYKCTVHFDMKQNQIGNLLESGEMMLNEVLHNQWYIKNRKSINENCMMCNYFPVCGGGSCPYKFNFESNDFTCHSSNIKSELPMLLKSLNQNNNFKLLGRDL